ncbi:SDR family NAD(P)-dependent oxidoreductase [Nonomuraea sp. NPDC004580]|uniref:SDR family NAD(P)-dependent oxidoreductase n=1 Tax=Nonomuraea sp. NPDC004580 TaxID=3154552 RepID=UPI0033AAB15A
MPRRWWSLTNPAYVLPDGLKGIGAIFKAIGHGDISHELQEILALRTSQINGCSACVHAHNQSLVKAGESVERIAAVAAWREAPFYTDAERAALELTEAVTRLSDRSGEAVSETNVFGVIEVTNAMLPLLRRSPAGRIVNVSSERGSIGRALNQDHPLWPRLNLAYCSAKTALNMITVSYAKELWHTPIKVNAVDPGWVRTDINQGAGIKSAEQGAAPILVMAFLDADGPTAAFVQDEGPLPW